MQNLSTLMFLLALASCEKPTAVAEQPFPRTQDSGTANRVVTADRDTAALVDEPDAITGIAQVEGHGGGDGTGSATGRIGTPTMSRRSKVVPGKPLVVGSLPAEVIRRIARRHINEIRHCYEKQLLISPDIAGVVAVKFTMGADGIVSRVDIAEDQIGVADLATCITNCVRRWAFPKPNGGSVVVTYPLEFSPN